MGKVAAALLVKGELFGDRGPRGEVRGQYDGKTSHPSGSLALETYIHPKQPTADEGTTANKTSHIH